VRNEEVPYVVMWGLSGSAVSFHIISNRQDFRKEKLLNVKCVF
jgi:hypothetical protein